MAQNANQKRTVANLASVFQEKCDTCDRFYDVFI